MTENIRVISTEEELKIFNDPYRMKIIRTFQKSKLPLTVKGVADLMEEVPAKVHYHVKKLLKIDILKLDHTEVINGITAKYYVMPFKSFTISVKSSDDQKYQSLAQAHSILTRVIDDFKEEFMKSSSVAVEKNVTDDSEVGLLASNELYLSKEEFHEISTFFTELSHKYQENSPEKNKYVFIGGLGKKIK